MDIIKEYNDTNKGLFLTIHSIKVLIAEPSTTGRKTIEFDKRISYSVLDILS